MSHVHIQSGAGRNRSRLRGALALTGAHFVTELVAGWLTGSLALLADVGHMLTDVAGLGLALFAIHMAERPATPERTYGYYRTEILAALANAVVLIGISVCAQIMARAGSDPRDMANMFKTIQAQGGSGMPEWLSDHPDPGNRYDYIVRKAPTLRVAEGVQRDTRGFSQAQARLTQMPPAPTTAEASRSAQNRTRESVGTSSVGAARTVKSDDTC